AFLAIPWRLRLTKDTRGTLFKQYYLFKSRNLESAFKKADHILAISEDLTGGGSLNGKRVVYRKIGILDLEPLYQELSDGVELFDESEIRMPYKTLKKQLIGKARRN